MNINLLHEKLIRAARLNAPSDRVPYAFEKRILARISSVCIIDRVSLWARALWRGAIPCVAVTVLLSVWAASPPRESASVEGGDLGAELETTLMASVSLDNGYSW